jgi:hypothetical protein
LFFLAGKEGKAEWTQVAKKGKQQVTSCIIFIIMSASLILFLFLLLHQQQQTEPKPKNNEFKRADRERGERSDRGEGGRKSRKPDASPNKPVNGIHSLNDDSLILSCFFVLRIA